MNELTPIIAGSLFFLLITALVYGSEKLPISERIQRNPFVYSIAICSAMTSYTFFGASQFAHYFGYSYLMYYLGCSVAFLFAPLMLAKLMDIGISHHIRSLADLLTFRFHNQAIGSITTIILTLCTLPLLAKQFDIISQTTLSISNHSASATGFSVGSVSILVFGIAITAIACRLDTQNFKSGLRANSLILLMASLALFTLLCILVAGVSTYYLSFNPEGGITAWLSKDLGNLNALRNTLPKESNQFMAALALSAVVTLPHCFHLIFAERAKTAGLKVASWLVPLYLLVSAIPVLPILWAYQELTPNGSPNFAIIAIGKSLQQPWLELLTYLGVLAATSAILITAVIALTGMWMNHIILAAFSAKGLENIYRWLVLWRRGILITLIALPMSWQLLMLNQSPDPALGILSTTGLLQLAPALLAVIYWNQCTRWGVIAGLAVGLVYWTIGLLLPMLGIMEPLSPLSYAGDIEHLRWTHHASTSLLLNTLCLIIFSRLGKSTASANREAKKHALQTPGSAGNAPIGDTDEMLSRLMPELGQNAAKQELQRAMLDLELVPPETRPATLRRIRNQLEINLSGFLGPEAARRIIRNAFGDRLGFKEQKTIAASKPIEQRLQLQKLRLSGLSAELHKLKLHHRQTLQDLPIGMCSISTHDEILIWNRALQAITGISSTSVIGSKLFNINTPWTHLLSKFLECEDERWTKQQVPFGDEFRWVNLIKTADNTANNGEHTLIVEDVTEAHQIEDQLSHQERLASIGRLAAGVAHEIGNPVTGIACLAQDLKYAVEDDTHKDMSEQILGQTKRITSIVESLVNFSHANESDHGAQTEPVSLHKLTSEAIKLVTLDRNAKPVFFENICRDSAVIKGNNQKFLQIIINLLNNARDASEPNASVLIMGTVINDKCHFTVTDEGTGIPKELHSKIFEPFFTTKSVGKGTGLGMSLVYSAVQEMGGTISIESPVPEFGCGTRIHLTFNTYSLAPILTHSEE